MDTLKNRYIASIAPLNNRPSQNPSSKSNQVAESLPPRIRSKPLPKLCQKIPTQNKFSSTGKCSAPYLSAAHVATRKEHSSVANSEVSKGKHTRLKNVMKIVRCNFDAVTDRMYRPTESENRRHIAVNH